MCKFMYIVTTPTTPNINKNFTSDIRQFARIIYKVDRQVGH